MRRALLHHIEDLEHCLERVRKGIHYLKEGITEYDDGVFTGCVDSCVNSVESLKVHATLVEYSKEGTNEG